MRSIAALVLVSSIGLFGCGGASVTPAEDVVAGAQESLEERDAGRIDFALEASAEGGDPVGFAIEGEYELGDDELAVMDVAYVVDTGDERLETRVISDGARAVLVADGEVVDVPEKQLGALRVGETSAPGPLGLDLLSWIEDPKIRPSADRTEVRGELRAAAFVAHLQTVAAGVPGGAAGEISAQDAERLERSVTASEIVIEVEGKEHELRSLRATVEFGARVPAELRKALGRYAGAQLSLTLQIDDLRAPLRIELPR